MSRGLLIRPKLLCCLFLVVKLHAAAPPRLELSGGSALRLAEPGIPPVVGTKFQYELESSDDLKVWGPAGRLDSGGMVMPQGGSHRFFRVRASVTGDPITSDGGDRLGFNRVFAEEMDRAGFLSVAEFQARYTVTNTYLEKISWDPATAKFWREFQAAGMGPNQRELELLKKNGFVVSERLGGPNFADVFYRIFIKDLPVFFSADAVLHAWHFSYDTMLMTLERKTLMPQLRSILDQVAAKLPELRLAATRLPLAESFDDADYLLSVARSLLAGSQVPDTGQERRVADTLARIAALQYEQNFPLFGESRPFDFSQFQPRGHYAGGDSPSLEPYFRAFMWLARAELHIFDPKAAPRQSLRELGTALVLNELLVRSGQLEAWRKLDQATRIFVGEPDNLTFPQMAALLAAANLVSLTNVTSTDVLADLQQRIVGGDLGAQAYDGQGFYSPLGPQQTQLPRAFAFSGQAFVPDGWVVSKVTFDRILWNEAIPGVIEGKVIRRRSTGLDVAFGMLDNRQVLPELLGNITNQSGMKFRDGLPYQHNLVAARATINRQDASIWRQNIYNRWLYALRALSEPATDTRFPEAMRTRAWAMKGVNTQLASWTQLRHDTILYAQQPYSGPFACEYPAGFVEPAPEFWRRMEGMINQAAEAIGLFGESFTFPGEPTVKSFCEHFASAMASLARMAEKELAQEPFSDEEVVFIRSTMNRQDAAYVGPRYDGWYPKLFFRNYMGQQRNSTEPSQPFDLIKEPSLVADVYTAVPDLLVGDIGGVLHTAVGRVDYLLIAVDNGPDRMIYAGPTLSHYEFTTAGVTRLADHEWQAKVNSATQGGPPLVRPPWTQGYLVPR